MLVMVNFLKYHLQLQLRSDHYKLHHDDQELSLTTISRFLPTLSEYIVSSMKGHRHGQGLCGMVNDHINI